MHSISPVPDMASFIWIYLIFVSSVLEHAFSSDTREYCIMDNFKVKCGENQVILMEEARYGRMRTGRCITDKYGNIGCSTNVITYMDVLCSGRRECDVSVRKLMDRAQPCERELTPYLEAKHKCVKVETGTPEKCHQDKKITVSSTDGYIASMTTTDIGYGSRGCPWHIKVMSGQRVSLDLYDFNLVPDPAAGENREPHVGAKGCPLSLVVIENGESHTMNLCKGTERSRNLYTSKSDTVSVHFAVKSSVNRRHHYLVHFKAEGCADLKPPRNAWITRDEATARVQCNHTQEIWYLTCKAGTWIGELGNCSDKATKLEKTSPKSDHFPLGLILAVVIGIALGVVGGIILLAFVMCCKKSRCVEEDQEDDSMAYHQRPMVDATIYYDTVDRRRPTEFTTLSPHLDCHNTVCGEHNPRSGKDLISLNMSMQGLNKDDHFHKVVPDCHLTSHGGRKVLRHGIPYDSPHFIKGIDASFPPPPIYHDSDGEHGSEDKNAKRST